jgi:uncharacterized protein (TIGR00661 family)
MKFEKINISGNRKRVLVAPLDWGLGHATRCIPIIYDLIGRGFEIIIAADGPIKILLKKEFPHVVFTQLKGYNISYSQHGSWLFLKLLLQLPKLLWSIHSEKKWLKKIVRNNNIDLVISDNRLGLSHKTTACIYITHQLKIKTGTRFTEWLAQKIHYFFINKYNSCWVPDHESGNDLAGELSHPKKLPAIPVKYLGPLSRFEKITVEKKYDLLVLLSGPEPQRTILENVMLKELKTFHGNILLVRGLPGNADNGIQQPKMENGMMVANHLPALALNAAILQSHLVICRSGYTTIMDLVKLQQNAILIPTPSQTEQEYLAAYLAEKKIFFSVSQKHFSLNNVLQKLQGFPFTTFSIEQEQYKNIISEFVTTT